jgi:7-carboxy-7-deazaguanine synthase
MSVVATAEPAATPDAAHHRDLLLPAGRGTHRRPAPRCSCALPAARCAACTATRPTPSRAVSIRSLDDIVATVAGYAPAYVTVTGGEPLAQPNCLPLLAAAVRSPATRSRWRPAARCPWRGGPARGQGAGPEDAGLRRGGPQRLCEHRASHAQRPGQVRHLRPRRLRVGALQARRVQRSLGASRTCCSRPATGSCRRAMLAEWILEDRLPVRLQLQLHKLLWERRTGIGIEQVGKDWASPRTGQRALREGAQKRRAEESRNPRIRVASIPPPCWRWPGSRAMPAIP